jgi:hypothetical protein
MNLDGDIESDLGSEERPGHGELPESPQGEGEEHEEHLFTGAAIVRVLDNTSSVAHSYNEATST